MLSFLPLSHITERAISHFGLIQAGGETWFARSLGTVAEDLRACRPDDLLRGATRVAEAPGRHHRRSRRARPSSRRAARSVPVAGETDPSDGAARRGDWPPTPPHSALDQTIGAPLRRKLGLDQARILVSAAAPIHPDLVRWFHGIGLPIAEGYGQTEDAGPTTLNPPDAIRIGTVGVPIPGVEVRVADDGEILVRGGNVCSGYFEKPDGHR